DVHLGTVLDVGAAREVLERLLLAVLDDLEVLGTQIRKVLALLVDDGDAEGGEIDGGAEGRRLSRDRGHTQREKCCHEHDECALLHRTSRSYTLSERLVHGDARRLRASADAVRPLERHERSERPARFDARADARIETRIRS